MQLLKNTSIRKKILLVIVSVTTITLFVYHIITTVFMIRSAMSGVAHRLKTEATLVGESCIAPLVFQDQAGAGDVLHKIGSLPNIAQVILYDVKNNPYAAYINPLFTDVPVPVFRKQDSQNMGDYMAVKQMIYKDKVFYGSIVVIESIKEWNQQINLIIVASTVGVLVLIIIAFLISLYFQRIITQPIIMLTEAAKRISKENDFSIRLRKSSNDEVGQLYDYFNVMLIKIDFYINELERNNKELEEFNYVASHDLREPLRTMTSYCELLEQDIKTELSADAKQDLLFLKDAAKRMNLLIQDLLELSRMGRSDLKADSVDLNACMEQVSRDLYLRINETKGEVTWGTLPAISGDYLHICRVLQNLVNNALKFHGDKAPRIHVSAEDIESDSDVKRCLIRIKDNGIGMDPKYLQQIFLPFKRLHAVGKFEGTGIGLAICKKIIERHNGKIEVESAPGEGSTFILNLIKHTI